MMTSKTVPGSAMSVRHRGRAYEHHADASESRSTPLGAASETGSATEHRLLKGRALAVYGTTAVALDLVVSAGIARATTDSRADESVTVFLSVFTVIAVLAVACSDWILQRVTRPR